MYIDKFDYLLNNLNNEEIDEEIQFIKDKLSLIEEDNIFFFKALRKKINSLEFQPKIDLNSESVFQNRYENLTIQIFTLQMKQLAESIWNIKKDFKKNKFLLIFDQSEAIEALSLDESDYKELLKYRDPMNSISVYDLFQEKIHSYFNNGAVGSGSIGRSNTDSNNIDNSPSPSPKKKRGRKPKKFERNRDFE